MNIIPPRLRIPALIFTCGTLFAAAWIVHGGHLWFVSIMAELGAIGVALSSYLRGGKDTDEGALAGSRGDERLRLVSTRARALAGDFALGASFAGLTISIGAKSVAVWPFLVMLVVTGFGRLLGMSLYGVPEDDPAEDRASGAQVSC